MAGPLAGIRILDITTFTQGGEATGFLCDLGAEVIKVEPRSVGDPGRRLTLVPPGVSTFFLPQNRGKKSIAIDLATDGGREALLRLAERCDAFLHNFRPGVVERLGIDYGAVSTVNSGIVYVEGTGLGIEGPDARRGVVDIIGQARGGLISVTGEDFPVPAGTLVSDYTGAMHLAIGLLSGLVHRFITGQGQRVESSMLGSMISLQGWEFTHYLVSRQKPDRGGRAHQLLRGLWGVYETSDGYIAISGIALNHLPAVAEMLERPQIGESRDGPLPERMAAIKSALADGFRTRPTSFLLERFYEMDVRCAAVQDYEQLANDPQVLANDYAPEFEHSKLGRIRMAGNPLRFSETPIDIAAEAPDLGEHTREVLLWLGYSEQEVERMIADGIAGPVESAAVAAGRVQEERSGRN